jgi:hypothetical protein
LVILLKLALQSIVVMKDGLVIFYKLVGEKKYLVRFVNGEERELPSAVLKVEHMVASLPPDLPIPTPQMFKKRPCWRMLQMN